MKGRIPELEDRNLEMIQFDYAKAFDYVDHKALSRGYIYQKQTSTC